MREEGGVGWGGWGPYRTVLKLLVQHRRSHDLINFPPLWGRGVGWDNRTFRYFSEEAANDTFCAKKFKTSKMGEYCPLALPLQYALRNAIYSKLIQHWYFDDIGWRGWRWILQSQDPSPIR